MAKKLRILLLLFILLIVAVDTWLTRIRTTDWDVPLRVVIYPINADHSESSQRHIDALNRASFGSIEKFFSEEAKHFKITLLKPVVIEVSKQLMDSPPKPAKNRNILNTIWWSLKMRIWATLNNNYEGPSPDIKVFVLYHDPDTHQHLDHSLGLKKGLIGVVNAFSGSDYSETNQVVIAHELLHTVGATDKYDLRNSNPLYPQGYAEPDQQPRLPQELAEIMAGRIPLTPTESKMPNSLEEAVIGEVTAYEIEWVKDIN